MAINVLGLSALVVFYVGILVVGIAAAWLKTRKGTSEENKGAETIIVAGRGIGLFVGVFTMTATWVGGGYINGTAEAVFSDGMLHATAPVGYALSLCIGGLFFAKRMREREYLTMLDPLQEAYGSRVGGVLFLPALMGELFWSAAILNALGSSVAVIMELDFSVSVIASACIAVSYTFFGGLYSVAYTDVLQLICIALGLALCIPYAWSSPAVCWELANATASATAPTNSCLAVAAAAANNSKVFSDDWIGSVPLGATGQYVDLALLLIFGGMPWQVYFQRVLSTESPWMSQVLSFAGALGCLVMCIPSVLVGVVAKHTDWGADLARVLESPQIVLPLLVAKLTPPWVSFFGLGAISAAVMSSSDSSILSASSMFAHNIYRTIFRPKARETEIVWVLRLAIVACGALATAIGLSIPSVYALFTLCSDFVYVLLFPQLTLVIYAPWVTEHGVLAGFASGLALRLLGGDQTLGIPALIHFGTQVPYKTLSMLLNLIVTCVVSRLMTALCPGRIAFLKRKRRADAVRPKGFEVEDVKSHEMDDRAKF